MNKQLFAAAARNAAAYTSPQISAAGFAGVRAFVNVTSISGAGTVTVKLQCVDPETGTAVDLPGATTAALGSTGMRTLSVRPGVAETANESVSDTISDILQAVATVATSTVTFSVSLDLVR